MSDHETFDLGDVALSEGATLRDAKLAYKTYGTLNEDTRIRATPSYIRRGTPGGTGRTSG